MDGEVAIGTARSRDLVSVTPDPFGLTALYPSLRRFAAVVSSSDGDPDDLLQAAVERLLSVQADVEDPEAYLRRCMVNLESNRRRGLGRFRAAVARVRAGTHEDLAAALLVDTPLQRPGVLRSPVGFNACWALPKARAAARPGVWSPEAGG